METTAGSKSVQRFIETWQTWRVMLLREPFVTALRVLEQADNPAKIAMERWAVHALADALVTSSGVLVIL